MDLELTEDQKILKETIRNFVEKELAPTADEIDRQESFPWESFHKMAKLGLLGMPIPQAYGGSEVDMLSSVIVIEEVGRVCASTALSYLAHTFLCANNIYHQANETQRRKYLPPLCSGEKIGAMAITEPWAGSDALSIRTKAKKVSNGYVLNGRKMFITNGPVADVFLIYARMEGEEERRNITSFVLERDLEGFFIGKKLEKLGMRGSPTGELIMEDCQVPKENLLGKEGDALKGMKGVLDMERMLLGSLSTGIAQGAYEISLQYAKQREQFGKPISSFQLMKEMLAEMAMEIESARLLTMKAAFLLEQGKKATKECSFAKLFGSRTAVKTALNAVQILGGYGYTREFPVERYLRDAKSLEIGGGTSEIQKLIIASEILK